MTTKTFANLFAGRVDAYGTEQGGCDRVEKPQQTYTHYLERVGQHLTDTPMGVYPVSPKNHVWWGCVDFDEGYDESWNDAWNLHGVLEMLGLNVWVEKSRSKGYHVWLFLSHAYQAHQIRKALFNACELVGAPTKEVNPKQERLQPGQLGNYVRLPYPHGVGGENGAQTMIAPDGTSVPLEAFLETAGSCTPQDEGMTIWRLARAIPEDEPAPKMNTKISYTFGDTEALIQKIHDEGPLDGVDRSSTLWKLARLCAEHPDYTLAKAFEVVDSANRRWGKDYADGVLQKLVEKAWNQ